MSKTINQGGPPMEDVVINWNTEYVRSVTYEARMIGDMAVIRAMFTTTKEVPADAVICTLDRPFLRRHDLMVTGVNGTGSYVRLLLGYPPNQTIIVNTYPIPANLPCIMQTCGGVLSDGYTSERRCAA